MINVTGSSCLLEIGEMKSCREYDKNLGILKTRGSFKELETLVDRNDEALAFLTSGLSVVGHVLAYADHKEITDAMTEFGFLVNGLAVLTARLNEEKAHVSYELLKRAGEG